MCFFGGVMKPIFIAVFCLYILSVSGWLYFTKFLFIPRLKELCDQHIELESDKKRILQKLKMAFISFSMLPITSHFYKQLLKIICLQKSH